MAFEKEAEKLYSKLIEKEVDGELQYFKERRVYPPFHKDGSIWWKQALIGNWKSFILVIFIVLITLGTIFEYTTNLKAGAECIARETIKLLPSIYHG